MKLCLTTAVYATVFAAMYISSEVFASETLYCFSCHGYDKDDPTKCESREGKELRVRKCPANSNFCIKYTATYKVPQMMGNQLKLVATEAHGVHCGTSGLTIEDCARNTCPNVWPKDISVENCKVTCCNGTCSFPFPNQDEINRYNQRRAAEKGSVDARAVAGKRSSSVTRFLGTLWLQSVGFALVALFRF